jgi:hypothetical protein
MPSDINEVKTFERMLSQMITASELTYSNANVVPANRKRNPQEVELVIARVVPSVLEIVLEKLRGHHMKTGTLNVILFNSLTLSEQETGCHKRNGLSRSIWRVCDSRCRAS